MSLRDMTFHPTYSSEESNLLDEFYIPALSQSIAYDRAVGFFSSAMLSYAAQGLSKFVHKSGVMRLLIGEALSQEEYDAVRRGLNLKAAEEQINDKVAAILQYPESVLVKHRLDLLSWLIAAKRLEIRFALTDRGMFHDKMGVLEDNEGNKVVFQGSANETVAALLPDFNFESIAVYPSWNDDVFQAYGLPYIKRFDMIWKGEANRVTTIDIPSRSYDLLSSHYRKSFPPVVNEQVAAYQAITSTSKEDGFPLLPTHIGATKYRPRFHQLQALQEWKANDFSGIMALATGSGKTITALHGATTLASFHKEKNRGFVLIVAVPYQVLADQWCEVMTLFGMRPHRCYRGRNYWQTSFDQEISSLNLYEEPRFVAAVVVNATLKTPEFQEIISRVDPHNMLFIGDECHHHNNDALIKSLPHVRYRLGLSATPWRAADDAGKARLKGYYSAIVSIYSIRDALQDGVLVPYVYKLFPVDLSEEETEEYQQLSDEIVPLIARKEQGLPINEDVLLSLLLARLRILGSANGKFSLLPQLVLAQANRNHCLFYCGDGSTEQDGESRVLRDVERVAQVLNSNGWKSSRFTARESSADRTKILENFRFAFIDAVVAIRVLDEGFDMPECETAFLLASSRNERQFIQRRGRILRTAPGKEFSTINDFLVLPAAGWRSPAIASMVRQELVRAVEFARFSMNSDEVTEVVNQYCDAFDLDREQIDEEVLAMEVVTG